MHKPVNLSEITFMVPPDGKTAALEQALSKEREALRTGDHVTKHQAQLNVTMLEEAIERSKTNDESRKRHHQELQAAREAKAAERQAADEAALKDRIRLQFFGGNPTASEEDFERLYPSLKDQHLTQQTDTALADARRRIARVAL